MLPFSENSTSNAVPPFPKSTLCAICGSNMPCVVNLSVSLPYVKVHLYQPVLLHRLLPPYLPDCLILLSWFEALTHVRFSGPPSAKKRRKTTLIIYICSISKYRYFTCCFWIPSNSSITVQFDLHLSLNPIWPQNPHPNIEIGSWKIGPCHIHVLKGSDVTAYFIISNTTLNEKVVMT